MSQPSKWWWGLLPLIVLWIVATVFTNKFVSSDLNNRSAAALGATVDSPAISVAGRDITASGTIFSPEDSAKVTNTVGAVWGVRKVLNDTKQPALANPFNWGVTRDGSTVNLTGSVPNPQAREKIVSAAKAAFAGAEIKDAMSYASGAPASYETGALFGLDQLARLAKGSVAISGADLTVSGNAATQAAYDGITAALKTLPQGITLAKADIAPPPSYAFDALKDAGKLTLTGKYPDDDTHGKILDAAKSLFFGEEIVDQLTAAPGAPSGFGNAAIAGLNALSRLAKGTFSLSNTNAKLTGDALYDQAVASVQNAFATAVPDGFKFEPAQIAVGPAAPAIDATNCQSTLNTMLTKSKINFETGKAQITPASSGLLDLIVATIGRCANSSIEISGHTDSSGDETANIALSEQRAKAVVDYLTSAGVSPERLTAVGLGSSRPIASNDTDEGKALNRRIEFSVK